MTIDFNVSPYYDDFETNAKEKMRMFVISTQIRESVLKEMQPMLNEQKEVIKNSKFHDRKIIQFHKQVTDMVDEVRRVHTRIGELEAMNEKIIETNFRLGQLSTNVSTDKSILENFRLEVNTKNRDFLQNSKIMEKNIANIGDV